MKRILSVVAVLVTLAISSTAFAKPVQIPPMKKAPTHHVVNSKALSRLHGVAKAIPAKSKVTHPKTSPKPVGKLRIPALKRLPRINKGK